jgi:hypothetical protein
MSFITDIFIKPKKPALVQIPSGSFTIDRKGRVLASTLPQSFQAMHVEKISSLVLAAFRSAEGTELQLAELVVVYSALKLVARQQRNGVIVFFTPQIPAKEEPAA